MEPMLDDNLLMDHYASSRDENAYEEIVHRFSPRIVARAKQVVGSHAAAQDVAQETFIKLHQTPSAPVHSMAGWLFKVAQQIAIDSLRSEKARKKREHTYGLVKRDRFAWKEVSPLIQETIDELPDVSKDLIHEYFLQEQTLRQMASERGVSPATMHRKVQAAVEQLRTRLSRKGVLMPAAALTSLLMANLAQAAGMSVAAAGTAFVAGGGSVLLAMQITAAISLPVVMMGVASQINVSALEMSASQMSAQCQLNADDAYQSVMDRMVGVFNRQGYYMVIPQNTLDPDHVLMFETPASSQQFMTTVLMGNMDILDLPVAELSRRIELQTGQSMQQFIHAQLKH